MTTIFRCLFAGVCAVSILQSATAAGRVPWNSSKVFGSPEPPLPYIAERTLHEHKITNATELDFIPGTHWTLILSQNGRLLGINPDQSDQLHTLANFANWKNSPCQVYSIEFHPNWKENRQVYISMFNQTRKPPHVEVLQFHLKPGNPPTLDLDSAQLIIDWNSKGHNGCDLHFGPDGFLYISAGDGEVPAPPDPRETGQDVSDLLASVMRIDVDQQDGDRPYRIPKDNPFVGRDNIRPEIWAYGFRNPWKMSFDPRDGALWIGDVGWELWEMLFRVDHGGFNGGWSVVEGPQSIHPNWPKGPTPIEEPVISHSHSEATSITGGFVYRGSRLPELRNAYIYGDWGSGKIWALWWEDGRIAKHQEIASTPHRIIGFAEDENNELFYLDYRDGAVYQLAPNLKREEQQNFPTRLSETGLFASTKDHRLAPGVYEYDIAAPMWSDHAKVQRAVAYPGLEKAFVTKDYFESPTNSVLVRTISMEMTAGNPSTVKRIETQIMHFEGYEWFGYTYRWNEDQTDAELVSKEGDSTTLTINDADAPGGERIQKWRFHSRAECHRCHQVAYQMKHGNMNGFSPVQLAGLKHGNQSELDRLIEMELIDKSAQKANRSQLVDPSNTTASLDQRARSYLHANCAHCHKPGSTGAVTMYWPVNFNEERTGAFGVEPARGAFGIENANIVSPGQPGHSTLLYRLLTTGTGRMPIIGSHEVDDEGIALLSEWIRSMETKSERTTDNDLNNTSSAIVEAVKVASLSSSDQKPIVAKAMNSSNVATRDLFQRFLPANERRKMLGAGFDPNSVLSLEGNIERGRELFFGTNGPQCFSCHRMNGNGRDFGPDLSKVGEKYTKELLLMHITDPNKYVDPPWRAHSIDTNDDESYTGFISKQNPRMVTIKTALGTVTEIARSRIASDTELTTSLMPEGTIDSLTPQEAADLLEFLVN